MRQRAARDGSGGPGTTAAVVALVVLAAAAAAPRRAEAVTASVAARVDPAGVDQTWHVGGPHNAPVGGVTPIEEAAHIPMRGTTASNAEAQYFDGMRSLPVRIPELEPSPERAEGNLPGHEIADEARTYAKSLDPKRGIKGLELGRCATCTYTIDLLRGMRPPTLVEVCNHVYKDHPKDFSSCMMVIDELRMNAKNYKAWTEMGCYEITSGTQRRWAVPCPARGVCSYFRDIEKKLFCGSALHSDRGVMQLVSEA